jgi:serine/threonine protein kinase/tetratricopeptide (TPR) repeat protein
MANFDADRNLLFGILALQIDFISPDQLVAGLNAWVLRKGDPLADVFEDQGVLSRSRRALLEPLVTEHLQTHGCDLRHELVEAAAEMSTRLLAAPMADPDLRAAMETITRPPSGSGPAGTGNATDHNGGRFPGPDAGGRYRIVRQHAKGGLGVVFLAHDTELNRQVALKEIQTHYADDLVSRARFLLEAEITGGLEHPGIVPVYGMGRYTDGRPYYAMRFIRGDSLKDAIEGFHEADQKPRRDSGERALELQKLLRRFLDVCEAVAYAHSRGVLHRDIKPGNVMVGLYGETLVVDWGLAKVVGRPEALAGTNDEITLRPFPSGGSSSTLPGSALGTPAYMSPEQAEGRLDDLSPASDVYSLGATLYCLLTGRAPFLDGNQALVLAHVAAGEFPRPRQVNPRVPAALEAVCRKAMALRPAQRYRTTMELAADIERWLADEPVSAYRAPLVQRIWRLVRRRPMAALVLPLFMVADFSVATYYQVSTRSYKFLMDHPEFMIFNGTIYALASCIYAGVILAQMTGALGAVLGVATFWSPIPALIRVKRGAIKGMVAGLLLSVPLTWFAYRYSTRLFLSPSFYDTPANEFLREAGRAVDAKKYWEAKSNFVHAIDLAPNDGELADVYAQRSRMWIGWRADYDAALADMSEAIRLRPRHSSYYLKRAAVFSERKDYDLAIRDLDDAIRLDPLDRKAYELRAQSRWLKKDFNGAIDEFGKMIRIESQDPRALAHIDWHVTLAHYINRGVAWERKTEYAKAIADYDQAILLARRDDPKLLKGWSWVSVAKAYRRRAWLLATCPDGTVRDGKRAVESATAACTIQKSKDSREDSRQFVVLAAAQAEAGEFDAASRSQATAIQLLKVRPVSYPRITDTWADDTDVVFQALDLHAMLKSYLERKAYRENQKPSE